VTADPTETTKVDDENSAESGWRRALAENNGILLAAAILIGAVTALANVAFHWAIDSTHDMFWRDLAGRFGVGVQRVTSDVFSDGMAAVPAHWWYIPCIPMLGMLAIVILDRWFPGQMKGYGLPTFLEIVNFRGGYLRRRWITLKTLSAAITLGSGMSAGIEGAIAQIGGSIGSTVGRGLRPSFERLRVLIACGSGAAISATFSSPIAGVFFAEEIVLVGEFNTGSMTLIVLASGTAAVVSRYLKADAQILTAPAFDFPINHEILFYLLMGLICGLLSVLFIRIFYGIRKYFQRSRIPSVLHPLIGGLLVGVILIFFPQVSSSGYDTMNEAFLGHMPAGLLLALVLAKMVATSITLGAGGSGGVFAPAMFIGTVLGGGYAALLNTLIPGVISNPGGFAMIGMGAFLAASTHAPLTAIFLLIELTRDYNVALPIMITGVAATMVARRVMHDSIDSYELSQRGLDIHAGSETNLLRKLFVRGLVSKDFRQIPETMKISDFVRYLTNSHHVYFPVVNKSGELTGIVSMQDIRGLLLKREAWPLVVVSEIANSNVVTVNGSDSLYEAMKIFTARGLEQLVVVDEENPKKVVGMLSRSDLQSFYQKRLFARKLYD